ncbi:MAG TPA: histone deacetylase [Calditrichia bacterium]|nr:histone deacetylase [Calditrichota bacterium]HQU70753.1 histone deacetylase [Calditrichia bacterium]HQV31194.1 histone deacetylase [Calditrichia bacterium]
MYDWDKLSFYYHPIFLEHLAGIDHPESPDRLRIIMRYLKEQGVWDRLTIKTPEPADLKWIRTNHSPSYIESVEAACRHAPAFLDGGDTIVTEKSYLAALHGVGACLSGVDDLLAGDYHSAFCLIRPPGHHAEYSEAMGFCLFNNVAIAARYALDRYALQRIFIIDWDVHQGNGTHHSFYSEAEVFFVSIHQWPLYPGIGAEHETGRGVGAGYTLNIPLPPNQGDEVYLAAFTDRIIPAMRRYHPDLLILSAGFDAHQGDPLAQMNLTTEVFAELTRLLRREMLPRGGKVLSVLEGGYHTLNLAESLLAHLQALVEPL